MNDQDAAQVAAYDQWRAGVRTLAEMWADITDEFVRAGYCRDESLTLTMFYLDGTRHDD